jgi:hypothetical protein
MKYVIARILFLTLIIFSAVYAQGEMRQTKQRNNILDLTKIEIKSEEAQKLFKADSIIVRLHQTDYQPRGELPVLKLETIDDEICLERLQKCVKINAGKQVVNKEIKSRGYIYTVELDDISCWISRVSGAYKFTAIKNSMAVPSEIDGSNEAVQIAMEYIGKNQLVELIDGEEIDILFVSAVKNALAVVDEPVPREEFLSDYYIGFGRRFEGVPIIGSQLVIRLSGKGDIAMVQKTWRKIIAVGSEKAKISKMSLKELISRSPEFIERYGRDGISLEDIKIVDKKCGYMEAPLNFKQEYLRPGANVSYGIGEPTDEMYSQIIISLEEGVDILKLWGKKYTGKQ